ncbi:peptidoglycan hydrolase-like protein with peptidoglycan-binding domain [Evansella vedderi]|uniref:Peptidoglycan hydrolase-like protein with peptidoglycan-binding domain n=1 Tax=Evansella vedderi TaxID=38282 RepID=A0ABU0A3I9_9BACI|nr:peptidoglycan hydrolase-like protein with peptidoglycan-binding domain [Evansella vedderi]
MSLQSKLGVTIATTVAATGVFLAAPNMAEASFGQRNLSFGMQNSDVVILQEQLKELGFFKHHTATGYFGPITRQAVQDFQRANRLTPDGIVGPKTFGALRSATASTKSTQAASGTNSNNTTSNQSNTPQTAQTGNSAGTNRAPLQQLQTNQTLRVGSRGAEVEKLQQYLKQAGFFDHPTVTGFYGAITEEAVRRFQRSRGLTVDGLAGRQTLTAVNKEIAAGSTVNNSSTNRTNNQSSGGTSSTSNTGSQTTNVSSTATQQSSQTAPTTTASQPASVILQSGSRGDSVTELQSRLRVLGHFNQEPTGFFGDITRNAVIQFQRQWNLVDDGLVTQATWNKLEEVSSVHLASAEPDSVTAFNVLNLIADAGTYIGTPYLWGGTTGAGFDCSGFIQYIFRKNGVLLPRTVAQQWNATTTVSKPRVGDIVYFETYRTGPSHNGIYIGNNQFIHSGSSTGVTISSLSNSYWSARYLGAKRIR